MIRKTIDAQYVESARELFAELADRHEETLRDCHDSMQDWYKAKASAYRLCENHLKSVLENLVDFTAVKPFETWGEEDVD